MASRATIKEVQTSLRQNLQGRPDLGLWKAVMNGALETPNPFEPGAARRPQRWFVLLSIVSLGALGAFFCFNCWN
jgi:hypothetical protein